MLSAKPTWENEVHDLFAAPYWIDKSERARVAMGWLRCMGGAQTPGDPGFLINLDKVDSVTEWSVTIYNHLASRSMPLTNEEIQFWPLEALETYRLWVNQGCRVSENDPLNEADRIPTPEHLPANLTVRPDIRTLSTEEINVYRARLDDILHIGDPDPGSPWQRMAYIHTNWCLHYQEAFCFWHRAYLLHFEALIDHPIPYWDWMAQDSSVDGSLYAGLPQAFIDENYVHPETGETRPNPLRYAAAKDGKSKVCVNEKTPAQECKFVQRNPLFYTSGDDHRQARENLYGMSRIFQQQVADALAFDTFSVPQGSGYPWANIPAFDPPQKNELYPNRALNFDGLYEQPHDNYHGWIGGDMADNSYTAFDPIFFSFHANIDRMLEVWIRNHPGSQYTSQVALQPFIGAGGKAVDYTSPDQWRYTSIGQMAQDSRRIGFDYGKPSGPQYSDIELPETQQRYSTSGNSGTADAQRMSGTNESRLNGPWVVFNGVRCTHDSFFIDVFLDQPTATMADVTADNPNYIGRFSRIGMGLVDDKGRCIKHGVLRALNAADTVAALGVSNGEQPPLSIVVTHLDSEQQLSEDEYKQLPGFEPSLFWGNLRDLSGNTSVQNGGGPGCCSVS